MSHEHALYSATCPACGRSAPMSARLWRRIAPVLRYWPWYTRETIISVALTALGSVITGLSGWTWRFAALAFLLAVARCLPIREPKSRVPTPEAL